MKRLRTTLLILLFCLSIQCRPVQEVKPKLRFDQIGAVIDEEIKKDNFPGAVDGDPQSLAGRQHVQTGPVLVQVVDSPIGQC